MIEIERKIRRFGYLILPTLVYGPSVAYWADLSMGAAENGREHDDLCGLGSISTRTHS